VHSCALRLSFFDDYHEASMSDNCQLQTLGPHGCSTCHCPIGHSSSVTEENSSSLRKPIACVAGGGFLFAFDFLTSLQSQGHLPPASSSFMCVMNAPLTPVLDSILRMYCHGNRSRQNFLYSPTNLLFHNRWRIHFPVLASFHSSILGCTY